MAQIKEILQIEKERANMEQWMVIHLFREGTFYRAYEWSAWLCLRYFTELKVTHRLLKNGEDIVFVGFPVTSIERYTPEGAVVSPCDDNNTDLLLSVEAFPFGADGEELHSDFENWKQSQPLTEASKKRKDEIRVATERNAHPRLSDVMFSILAYPIEQHSPMECMMFLSDMKKQISEIL